MKRSRPALFGLVVAVVVIAAGAATGGWFGTAAARHTHPQVALSAGPTPAVARSAGTAPRALPTAGVTSPVAPTRAGVDAAVGRLARAAGLGSQVRARVVDLTTGAVVFDDDGTTSAPPASVAKILTATALLAVRSPTDRLRTSVVAGAGGALVLVGGGDPTITGARAGASGYYAGAARLSDLATQLARAHVHPSRIVVDDALFTGPSISPAWAADDVPSDYGAAITAVTVDGGRPTPHAVIRSAQPDLAAGHELAALLGHPTLPVARASAAQAAAAGHAPALASVESAPLITMIEQMLHESDNVIAETLARQIALATHQPASFLGAAAAVRAVLRGLGVDDHADGGGFVDASGLARRDRVTPATLVATLQLDARTPRLRPLFAALPVAGWSGTLAERYQGAAARPAVGVVRAKTGTLTGVSSLAGVIHDRSGALLGFAIIADRAPSTPGAEAALDAIVERLAGCGCS